MPKNKNNTIPILGMCSRSAVIERSIIDEENKSIRTVITTEQPAMVLDWARWDLIREILIMDGCQIPESKQVVMLDSHSRNDLTTIKGSTRNIRVEKNELVGEAFFAKDAEREWDLVKDGHLTDVSAGYKTFSEHTVIIPPGEKAVIGGRTFKNNYKDDLDLIIRTKWEIKECSLVAIGADSAAKFRSEIQQIHAKTTTINHLKGDSMSEEELRQLEAKHAAEIEKVRKEAGEASAKRAQNISSCVRHFHDQVDSTKFDIVKKSEEYIQSDKSADDFAELVFQNIKEKAASNTNDGKIGMNAKEIEAFSITRAVNAVINNNWDKAGLEKAVSIAARAINTGVDRRGAFTIPLDVIASGSFGKRELSVGTAAAGGNLVGTDLLPGSFIDLLRNTSVASLVNVTMLEGLVGNIAIPKQTASGSAAWVATEGTDASDTNLTIGQLTLNPKTIAARTEMTRQLLMQSTPSIDRLAESDLLRAIALAIDLGMVHGSGASGQPKGVVGTTGVGSVTGTAFSFTKAVEFKKKVKVANAFKQSMAYITNPTIEAALETTEKASGTARYILEDGKVAGHALHSTNQVASIVLISTPSTRVAQLSVVSISSYHLLKHRREPML